MKTGEIDDEQNPAFALCNFRVRTGVLHP
jgi:hypothetical protein